LKDLAVVNQKFISLVNKALLVVIVLIAFGLIYQLITAYQFLKNCPDNSCGSNVGILFFSLLTAEGYLIAMLVWLRILKNTEINPNLKLIQLMLIIIFGLIPGIIFLFPAFFAD
jgi:hypothetical protein